jgi:hypothetical protein
MVVEAEATATMTITIELNMSGGTFPGVSSLNEVWNAAKREAEQKSEKAVALIGGRLVNVEVKALLIPTPSPR